MDATTLLGAGASWWYTSPLVAICVTAVVVFAGIVYWARGVDVDLIGYFCFAHTIMFVVSGSTLLISELLLPILAIRLFGRRQGASVPKSARGFVTTAALILGTVLLSLHNATEGATTGAVSALKFIVWGVVPALFVARRLKLDDSELTRLYRWLALAGACVAAQLLAAILYALLIGNSIWDVLGERDYTGYVNIPIGASNTLAAILVLTLICTWAARESLQNTRFRIFTCLQVAAVMCTMSRGAVATLIAAVLIVFLCVHPGKWKRVVFIATFIGISVYSLVLIASDNPLLARLQSREVETGDVLNYGSDVTSGRLIIWGIAIEQIQDRPVWGIGFHNAVGLDAIGQETAHNLELNILRETGIVGLLPFLVMWVLLFRLWRRSRLYLPINRHLQTLSAVVVAGALNTQIESPEANAQYFFFFTLLLTTYIIYASRFVSAHDAPVLVNSQGLRPAQA